MVNFLWFNFYEFDLIKVQMIYASEFFFHF